MTSINTQEGFFSDVQIAAMLGRHPVTVRKWRKKNREAGCIKFGPPYEIHGNNIVYPKKGFRTWCAAVQVVDGVPCINLPVTSTISLPRTPVAAAA